MKQQNKLFLILSLLIACSNCLFVWINYSSSKKTLQKNHEQVGNQLNSAFHTALSATETRMLQISTFISSDQRIQELFLAGKQAVDEEGGGPGGEKAAKIRQELQTLIGPSRDKLAEQFQFRQLHFHLGPGSLSFLRVHKPDKFGDRMDDVRYTIVVANDLKEPTTGFETGRVISGIRGVSPVSATDPETGKQIHTGALEAGTSFNTMLSFLKENEDAHFAVVLTKEHMEENIWPEFLVKLFEKNPPVDGYMVESTTSPAISEIMKLGILQQLKENPTTISTMGTGSPLAVTGFPLRDFQGKRDSNLPDVGMVIAWRDISRQQELFRHNIFVNIIFALIGFLLIEIILFFGIKASSKKLEELIEEGKADLKKTNTVLKKHINRRVKAEKDKEKIQARLLQAQKLESVGQLAAGIAHEINTPAQYVETNINFLTEAFQDAEELINKYNNLLPAVKNGTVSSEMIADIEATKEEIEWAYLATEIPSAISQSLEGVRRVTKIVRAMKEFSHPGSSEKAPANINHIIENTLTVASNEWKDVATTDLDLDPSLPQVPCLTDEMGQVILNIIVNASHAIRDKIDSNPDSGLGVIRISTHIFGDCAEIRIQDSGTGIPASAQDKIFDPFFTTKEVGKGTGQGMSIARDVVEEKHGGTLTFETGQDKGTTFIIRLPIA